LHDTGRKKYLKKGLDTPPAKQPDGQISRPHSSQGRAAAVQPHRNMSPYFSRLLLSRLVSEPEMGYAGGLFARK
jgi:hypothetical protein